MTSGMHVRCHDPQITFSSQHMPNTIYEKYVHTHVNILFQNWSILCWVDLQLDKV
jgi:hypothetical protein